MCTYLPIVHIFLNLQLSFPEVQSSRHRRNGSKSSKYGKSSNGKKRESNKDRGKNCTSLCTYLPVVHIFLKSGTFFPRSSKFRRDENSQEFKKERADRAVASQLAHLSFSSEQNQTNTMMNYQHPHLQHHLSKPC